MKTASSRRIAPLVAAALLLAGSPAVWAQFGTPVVGGTPVRSITTLPTVALDSAKTVSAINVAAFDDKDHLLDDIDERISRAAEAVGVLNTKSLTLDPSAQQYFREALTVARNGDDALKKAVKTARDVAIEQWNDARATLTAAYTTYADALMKLEATIIPPNEVPR